VYAKCLSLLKNEALARDATQEIFTKIFLNLSRFGQRSRFSTWVYSITYNYCIDFLRKQQKKQALFSDELDDPPDLADQEVPDYELLEMEVQLLKKVLDDIPAGDKAVLLMKYQDDMSIRDMAEVLDKSESAIKMKLKRAKAKAMASKKSRMADAI
jgi:RNA polymerase sigma-70 factor (ECF subfamily)